MTFAFKKKKYEKKPICSRGYNNKLMYTDSKVQGMISSNSSQESVLMVLQFHWLTGSKKSGNDTIRKSCEQSLFKNIMAKATSPKASQENFRPIMQPTKNILWWLRWKDHILLARGGSCELCKLKVLHRAQKLKSTSKIRQN